MHRFSELRMRVWRFLGRGVTVLFIPHSHLPLFKLNFSIAFLVFGFAAWSLLTIWAGWIVGRNTDYWVTKADNMVLRARMNYMVSEVDKAREFLDVARFTDRQLRQLLGMRVQASRPAEGLGGPTSSDRAGLMSLLSSGRGAQMDPQTLHRTLTDIRSESERRLASFQEITWFIANQRSLMRATPSIWPAAGRITSPFGYRFSPIRRSADEEDEGQFHAGIDIANSPETPIYTTADGVVRIAGWAGGYGQMILIDHGFGYTTLYGHTAKVLVRVGERVKRRTPIALMGATGRATGTHLHYEVWQHGRPVNPLKYLQVQPHLLGGLDNNRS
ncbi:MAG: M23 family metallopeptidase [Elusimicrobiota bacterium]|jgi:CubicO group peptidase (beta-lactamase class C family)